MTYSSNRRRRGLSQFCEVRVAKWDCPPARYRRRRRGLSLVELLMVVAICNILASLLFPAIQAAREAAGRVQCADHLKQIGMAWDMHHTAHQHLPTGGWGWSWVGDPDRGYDGRQPGSWAFNILPYVEQDALHELGAGMSAADKKTANMQRLAVPLPLFNCPSRRPVQLYPTMSHPAAINCGNLATVVHGDYSANVGNPNTPVDPAHCIKAPMSFCECNSGPPSLAVADGGKWPRWPKTTAYNGVSFGRSTVQYRQITDGLSHTAMVGEKYMNPVFYETGTFGSDNESLYAGFDDDLHKTMGFGPMQDAITNSDYFRFGSIHSGAFNMVFCDGSVHHIAYEIDSNVFSALGSRAGGETIDASVLGD